MSQSINELIKRYYAFIISSRIQEAPGVFNESEDDKMTLLEAMFEDDVLNSYGFKHTRIT